MLIFIDTEFTDFIDTQLISVGLVTEDNCKFYAELNDFEVSRCSPFVKDIVLPQLGKDVALVMDTFQLRKALTIWLAQFAACTPIICYDFDGDWILFKHLMQGNIPVWLGSENIWPRLDELLIEQFFFESGLSNHHALNDALANKFSYRWNP